MPPSSTRTTRASRRLLFTEGGGSAASKAVADSWNFDQSTEAEGLGSSYGRRSDVSKRGLNPVYGGLTLLAAVIGAGLVVGILRDRDRYAYRPC